ncbi:protein NRDE2 homolog isoform X5 [Cucurbita moschata]|uniref:Protein NRDE2 homolog isoform X5 n=1 Tax=Cucurbita moschata TaxID=3662 RepID=A0A6J1E7N7_CUCMO|nr:protein NRDE2 homolog isoform X5 [Cucurbita moschata]
MEAPAEEELPPEEQKPKTSLFPLPFVANNPQSQISPPNSSVPQWLCNSSFTTDLSVINDALSSQNNVYPSLSTDGDQEEAVEDEGGPSVRPEVQKSSRSYELLESSASDDDSDHEKRKKRKKKKRRRRNEYEEKKGFGEYGSRKSDVRAWADAADGRPSKDYYFDSNGDRDNLAFGSLYRMDVARYRPLNHGERPGLNFNGFSQWNKSSSALDKDADAEVLDSKLKSGGRYWSAKNAAIERHKNFKRVRIGFSRKTPDKLLDDFIPFSDSQTSNNIEESWEDEVLRKTREFNKLTREHPHDEKAWLAFAEFQDKVAAMQPQKGARLQTLEKKISILEKAAELNPENEELLLYLLKNYQKRDTIDVVISTWEKILMQNSGSYKLWREFLHLIQGEFSRFKVSDMRQMYAHAIQALSAACNQHIRQANQTAKPSVEHDLIQLELGLVDIFLSLCRFEWQAGYQELATALFQAEIEFSLFCPALHLNDRSKQRLFEHFWNTDAERVGEEGALGWSTWLEKEEENRQKVMREEEALEADEKGGWTGWSDPAPKEKKNNDDAETTAEVGVAAEEAMEQDVEEEDTEREDSTEALLKILGINPDAGVDEEVKDTSTWARWSKEESLRDCEQWMPIRENYADVIHDEGMPDGETNEQFQRVILYEDVKEYLFSLISSEARLSLIYQLIEFFSGKICSRVASNSSSWMERILSLEVLPDDILHHLRSVHDVLNKRQSSSSSFTLEVLVGGSDNLTQMSDMMKFLRNVILLCLTAFPRNFILEEAALIAEELFVTKMNSCSSSVTPCRSLAKNLLKSDRQDMLLCGVYARREATHGNIDHARKVFDMALASVESLPVDQKSNAPLLYFWYAELELAKDPHNGHDSVNRAVHILSCLGNGDSYSPFKCQPSSLQLLRAHQGFKEKIRAVRSTWLHGVIDDSSVALISSAALFEELTTGYNAGLEVLDQAFNMVLPERRKHSYQLECLFNYYVKMLLRHHKQLSQLKVRESISQGLQFYPLNPELYTAFLEISYIYSVPSKLRWTFDDYCQKQPSLILWIFALSFEMGYAGSPHRIRRLFEKALENDNLRHSVLLWRCYISYELNTACDPSSAKRVFFRAIHSCPWSKKLWLDGFIKLNSILSAKELSDLQEVMHDKELNLRTDIYEILLQEELIS